MDWPPEATVAPLDHLSILFVLTSFLQLRTKHELRCRGAFTETVVEVLVRFLIVLKHLRFFFFFFFLFFHLSIIWRSLSSLSSQSYGFSSSHVQMSEMDHEESWAPKNRCFWILVLEKDSWEFLRLQRSNQSILKEINSEYSLNGLMLNLKFQYFGPLMQRANLLGRTLMLGKIEVRRRRRQQRMRWLNTSLTQSTWIWANSRRLWRKRSQVCYSSWGPKMLDRT